LLAGIRSFIICIFTRHSKYYQSDEIKKVKMSGTRSKYDTRKCAQRTGRTRHGHRWADKIKKDIAEILDYDTV
jgi:hypothetical protein